MSFLAYGIKFRTRIIVVVFGICTFIAFILWNKSLRNLSGDSQDPIFFDPKLCNVPNARCVYDSSNAYSMKNDDEIVVSSDTKTGQVWTLGHVRRDPTSESLLLPNETVSSATNYSLIYPTLVIEPNEKQVKPTATNRTNGRFLIFNRVPKCASSMFVDLLWKLMTKRNNHFKYFSWKSYWERQLTIQKEKEFLEWLTVKKNAQYQYKSAFAMDRHVYFIDSTSYKLQQGMLFKFLFLNQTTIFFNQQKL